MTTHQLIPAKPATTASPSFVPVRGGLLQRKCACGGTSGDCAECDKKKRNVQLKATVQRAPGSDLSSTFFPTLQRQLTIGASSDPLEQEADRVADQVLAAPVPSVFSSTLPHIQRFSEQATGQTVTTPASVDQVLADSGRPLDPALKQDMERRFGHDFSRVRVHSGVAAEQSARDVNALAYAAGNNIVFGAGQFSPENHKGRRLIAHELTHVVQQSGEMRRLQRAVMTMGALTVSIDYGNVNRVTPADQANRIVSMITTWSGSAPDAAQETAIRALTEPAQRWMMFGLQLLLSNSAAATLDRELAVERLLIHASGALYTPLPDPDNDFVREVLRVSGWSEVALTDRLTVPNAAQTTAVRTVVNPPPSSGSASDPLDAASLQTRLEPALRHLLTTLDPGNWTNVGTRSISTFQSIGDLIQAEARSFFSPYADASIANLFDIQPTWRASANIFDTGALIPNRAQRLGYLANRAEIVGRNIDAASPVFIDTNIFADVHFDATRAADRQELFNIISTMEADATIRPIVDRLIQHTGRQSGSGTATRIGLVTEFNADRATACQDHWRGIATLCHEVMHALVHPNFVATATRVSFPQVIREGFTEVLGVQLFNDRIVPKAASTMAFKTSLEAGVAGAPCPVPVPSSVGYGTAGAGAETIRNRVGNENFRAAYLLGRPELAGLPL